MEVRESSFGREQLGEMPNRANVAPRNSGAAHTRVDREVPSASASAPPRFDFRREPKCRGQTGGPRARKLFLEQRREHNDRASNTECSKLFSLADGRDAITPGLKNFNCPQRPGHTKPISVRFDHWKQRYTGAASDSCPITLQRAKIDIDPGAR